MKHNGKTSLAEFRAIVAIAIILVLAISFSTVYDRLFPDSTNLETVTFNSYSVNTPVEAEEQSTYSYEKSYTKSKRNRSDSYSRQSKQGYTRNSTKSQETPNWKKQVNCQEFNPNTVSMEELIAMGISSYVSNNLIKFRQSGATFRTSQDVKKIYGIDSTLFLALEVCISIPSEITQTVNTGHPKTIDINTASIEDWKSLPGIGEVLATRIMNYREHLGGFHSIPQVGETYGLPPETLDQIKDKLVTSSGPRKLDINTSTVEVLAAHPYITQKQAETIVNYRNNHGRFAHLEDILKIYSLQAEWLDRIQPYLLCRPENSEEGDLVIR